MASLYKKPILLKDPKSGERVKGRSAKWWGRYRDVQGCEKRVPLARDKPAAQAMLNQLVRKVELQLAGKIDLFDDHEQRPLKDHVKAYEKHLLAKDNNQKYVGEVIFKIGRVLKGCKWQRISDLAAGRLNEFLAKLRRGGLSAQTSNHHLRAMKQFSRWLVRDRRLRDDQLVHVSMINVKLDRRHDRRALAPEEFERLIQAAELDGGVENIAGPDRAIMYVLSAWTGYRKGEIGSLTPRSLDLDGDPPTATVAAAYSKRRREDTQVLHPVVVQQLRAWLATKHSLKPDTLLFPISKAVPGGVERKTAKMMRHDLQAARQQWIQEGATAEDRRQREASDFLCYCDHQGRFADFHSNRHTFITSLSRNQVSPRTAQSLARHSDIRLTMGIYTHIELLDQSLAIATLPAPPSSRTTPPQGVEDDRLEQIPFPQNPSPTGPTSAVTVPVAG